MSSLHSDPDPSGAPQAEAGFQRPWFGVALIGTILLGSSLAFALTPEAVFARRILRVIVHGKASRRESRSTFTSQPNRHSNSRSKSFAPDITTVAGQG